MNSFGDIDDALLDNLLDDLSLIDEEIEKSDTEMKWYNN